MVWKDRKAFTSDLKTIYKASIREEAEANLLKLEEKWGGKYGAAVKSWQNNWKELATFFEFPKEIRRLIYKSHRWENNAGEIMIIDLENNQFAVSIMVNSPISIGIEVSEQE